MRLGLVAVGLILTGVTGCAGGPSADDPGESQYVSVALPSGPMGLYVEGQLARRAGDDERALTLLNQAVRGDDRLILANQALGEIYRDRGELSMAERFLRQLVDRDPGTATGHVLLGEVLELSTRFTEAIDAYLRGLAIEPDSFPGNLGAARSYSAINEPEQALPFARRAADLRADDAGARTALARALAATGRNTEADDAYRLALELIGDDPVGRRELLLGLGMNLIRQNRGRDALDPLTQAADLRDGPQVRRLLGDAHLSIAEARRVLGERAAAESAYIAAIEAFERALTFEPRLTPALNAKGSAHFRLWELDGRLDDSPLDAALDAWRRSLAVDPDQPRVRAAVDRFGNEG
jgi:tetratricopeptide (TPR) repeat protein